MESPRVTKLIQGRSKQLNNKPRSDSGGSTEACAEDKNERKPLCAAQPMLSPLGAPLDNSLTSLHWLQNVRIVNFEAISIVPEQQQPELLSASCSDSDESSCSSDGDVYQEFISNTNFRKCLDELAQYKKSKKDYTLELSKPIYSYVTLIFLAITSSSTDMTLHDICKWIKDNFCYYRIAAFGWQNSVRHNLSTNNLFVKVSRVTGKGNYWRINPKYVEFVNGGNNSLKRKNGSQKHKRCDHSQSQSVPDPCKVPGDLDWISLLGSQKVNCSKCGSIPSHSIGFSPFVSPDLNNFVTETTVPSTPEFGLHKLKANHNQNDAIFETEEQVEVPCLVQDSPFVLPGADSRPHSPVILDTKYHPWAESTPDKGRRLGLSWTSYSPHPITTAGAAPAISQW